MYVCHCERVWTCGYVGSMCIWVVGYQCLHAWLIEVSVLDPGWSSREILSSWFLILDGLVCRRKCVVGRTGKGSGIYCRFLQAWNKIPKHFSMACKS